MPDITIACGQDSTGKPRELLTEDDGTLHVNITGGAVGGQTVAQGDPQSDTSKPWIVKVLDAAGAAVFPPAAAPGDSDSASTALSAIAARVQVYTGSAWKRLTLGAAAPTASVPVTGSVATAQAALDDVTASGSATAFGSLAAGPGGIVVQNTSAIGGPNVRVDGAPTATHGIQLAPGEKWTFAVDNASRLKHYAESGSPTVSAAQA